MHRYGSPRRLSQSMASCPFIDVSAEILCLQSLVALVYGTFIDLFSTRKHKQKKRPNNSSDHKNAIARQQPAAVAEHRISKCPMLSSFFPGLVRYFLTLYGWEYRPSSALLKMYQLALDFTFIQRRPLVTMPVSSSI